MTGAVTFEVRGEPVQQGSTKGWLNPKTGKVQIAHDNPKPLRSWRQDVAAMAADAGCQPIGDKAPVRVEATFRFSRPATVSAKKRPLPSVKPDIDKLVRALLDALTGVAFVDDAQVVALEVQKLYSTEPGLTCTVGPAVALYAADVGDPQLTLEAVG